MKKLLLFIGVLATLNACSQSTLNFRGDTIRFLKVGGSAAVFIENTTKDTAGLAYNAGSGEVRFKRPFVLNDSTIVLGNDTLTVPGTGGATALTIDEVNDAIVAVTNGLNLYVDSVLMPGTGTTSDRYTIDTTTWIETKSFSKIRIDSLVNAIGSLALGSGGGILDLITNASGTGDSLWVQTNDSVGYIKRINAGTNVTFTVDGNKITINASSGSAEINTDSLNIATTTDNNITGSAMLEYVMVKPVSNLSSFKIGTAADPEKYFPGTPVIADTEYVVFDVGAYLQGTTGVRFSGITSTTDIVIVFKTIHQ